MFKPDDNFTTYSLLNQLNESAKGYDAEDDCLDDDAESLNEMFKKYTQ